VGRSGVRRLPRGCGEKQHPTLGGGGEGREATWHFAQRGPGSDRKERLRFKKGSKKARRSRNLYKKNRGREGLAEFRQTLNKARVRPRQVEGKNW